MTRGIEQGSALIEFTLLILTLMLLALGVFDFGLAIQQGQVVTAAAFAGAEFGAADGNANNTSGMQSAALNSGKSLAGNLVASANTWCTCVVGSTVSVSCISLCNSYDLPLQYVQVNVLSTVPILLHFSGLPNIIPLSASVTLRAR